MPGAHKIGAAISGPRIVGGNFMDITLFLIKGKIVSALFRTLALCRTFSHSFQSFSEFFLQDFFLELSFFFFTVLVRRDEKRITEKKKKKTKPFCTLVVARLSSSEHCYTYLAIGGSNLIWDTQTPALRGFAECYGLECAAVAAIRLQMRMQILKHPQKFACEFLPSLIECFRARHRGGRNFTSFLRFS